MSNEPKREDYPTNAEYIEAMCKQFNIPVEMTKQPGADVYAKAEEIWKKINCVNEPRRYEPDCEGEMSSNPKGNYVLMEDYAALKAEVERLKSILQHTDRLLLVDGEFEAYSVGTLERANARLERLIKAGDGLCASAYLWETDPAVLRWNAAKNLNS